MDARIVTLAGDGIGPELMTSGLEVLEKINQLFKHNFTTKAFPIGGDGIDTLGDPYAPTVAKACKSADAILLAAIGGPKWVDAKRTPEDGLLAMRKDLGLYANLRPVQVPDSLTDFSPLKEERVKGTDFIVVRELTGGLYFGQPKVLAEDHAVDTLTYTKEEIERIGRKAFEIAQDRDKKVTSVDKANVLMSSRLWRQTMEEIAADYPDVALDHLYVDAAAMKIIQSPTQFDVIVTENLFGDILSDESSVISGSLGMLPSASHGSDGPSLYEPIHGSAPDIAGQNVCNPSSMILSVAMMLRQSFKLNDEATAIENAVFNVIANGIRTRDLGGDAKTTEFTQAVIDEIEQTESN